jgi:xanthosine utilization system XapX-like protein
MPEAVPVWDRSRRDLGHRAREQAPAVTVAGLLRIWIGRRWLGFWICHVVSIVARESEVAHFRHCLMSRINGDLSKRHSQLQVRLSFLIIQTGS